MDEIGSVLYEARLAKGMSLDMVQEKLKIQQKYLLAMEEGRFEVLPTQTHARGYLRNYAKLLELDAQPLLEGYQTQLLNGSRKRAPKPDVNPNLPPGSPFFDPVNMQLNPMRAASGESYLRLIVIVALIVMILLIGSKFFLNNGSNPSFSLGDAYDTLVARINGETPPTAADINTQEIIEANEVVPDNPLPVETSRNAVAENAVAPDFVPVFACPSAEVFNLQVDATERVWLQLYVDGQLEVEDNLTRGETLEFTANDSFRINTGNAYALVLTVNNDQLGRLGQPQGVVDVSCEAIQ